MSLHDLQEAEAWALLLQAREHDWAGRPQAGFALGKARLEVAAGGRWCSSPTASPAGARLLDLFLPLVARPGPLALGQLGQSLDGRIATVSGASHYINGEVARAHLHRLRAICDAVVVGVGTVDADDPQLTVRHVPGPHPVRVVLDPRRRAKGARKVFVNAIAPTLHLVAPAADDPHAAGHVEQVVLEAGAGGFAPAAVLACLAERGLVRVLVEGGGVTVSRFVQAGVLDRLHVMVAPMLIGSGRSGLDLAPIATLDQALRPACRTFACGEDTLFDLALR